MTRCFFNLVLKTQTQPVVRVKSDACTTGFKFCQYCFPTSVSLFPLPRTGSGTELKARIEEKIHVLKNRPKDQQSSKRKQVRLRTKWRVTPYSLEVQLLQGIFVNGRIMNGDVRRTRSMGITIREGGEGEPAGDVGDIGHSSAKAASWWHPC